ncbi:ABC transporter [Streptomyces noursei ATCC 11455]|uniref:ABC transporter ATP-binding protein n=1 Tax=Streptomyces noursei TaxID=1971 RepID=UPI00081C3E6A|nr:ABC transporter [Streptomyces noursei ATCC 11455]
MNTATDPVVRIRGLRMRYGQTDVLRGIDLDVCRGEVLALLGPNGAGKTTTLEILQGYRRRSGGDVSVLGADPEHAPDAWRERVGVVLQSWRDHAQWRVGELLEHAALLYSQPREVSELLELVGLTEHRRKTIGVLSGGQRRRLDVALGVVGRPELLFLDEPTAGFDPVARRQFHELVQHLAAAEGVTVLLTTHDLAEAERLADRIAILVRGSLTACGTADELAAAAEDESEVRWRHGGTLTHEFTRDPSALVYRLHQKFEGPIPGLVVRRPTLEDTYLSMVKGDR